MGNRDLVAKYGGKSTQAINRAIRAELTCGARILDELEYWHGQVNVHRETGHAEVALKVFEDLKAEMVAEIKRRYNIVTLDK